MKIAIVCANGIGDALIFHTASAQLKAQGHKVVTFTNHRFAKGWQEYEFARQEDVELLKEFDRILLQHDNTPKAKYIRETFPNVYSLFGSYFPSKHGALREGFDYVCDRSLTLLDNLKIWLQLPDNSNGLQAQGTYRRFPKRVVLHTSSGAPKKNWPHFEHLAALLKKGGFDPFFLETMPTLDDLATLIYESGFFIGNDSGPGHLASCLKIPTLTLAGDPESMALWRPGWGGNLLVFPPMSLKISRKYWKICLRPKRVFAQFQNLVKSVQTGDLS